MRAVIYLTGAPATGKSTLSRNLKIACPELISIRLQSKTGRTYCPKNGAMPVDEREIREKSSLIVTPNDIEELDAKLVELVRSERSRNPILIDSHAVTKENYGFRVTGFSTAMLTALNPTSIVCLYASSDVVIDRIKSNPMGRPSLSKFDAEMHTLLQANLAVQYGVILGKPVYVLSTALCRRTNSSN